MVCGVAPRRKVKPDSITRIKKFAIGLAVRAQRRHGLQHMETQTVQRIRWNPPAEEVRDDGCEKVADMNLALSKKIVLT